MSVSIIICTIRQVFLIDGIFNLLCIKAENYQSGNAILFKNSGGDIVYPDLKFSGASGKNTC
jgi:hypothetical protein